MSDEIASCAAGESPCAKLATECSAAAAIATDAHRAPPFAGGNEADVRRNRFLRFRPIPLVRYAPDLGAQLRELLLDRLVAAIDVIDTFDLGAALGNESREHQARRGAQVGRHHGC